MSALRLAHRYAKSILTLAIKHDKVDAAYTDMMYLAETIDASKELRLMFKSPIINPSKKKEIVEAVFKNAVGPFTFQFIMVMIDKGREQFVESIIDAFVDQYNAHKRITPVQLITATELSEEAHAKVKAAIEKMGADTVELETKVEADLVGGFILKFDDKLYDSSVKRQLNELRKSLSDKSYIKQL